jgi:hypothetical protein
MKYNSTNQCQNDITHFIVELHVAGNPVLLKERYLKYNSTDVDQCVAHKALTEWNTSFAPGFYFYFCLLR